ncbi:MAG: flagellar hook-length control protein FliK [Desulfobacula sp.]|nr:flagellar hook-length control protein FliK [Desulfobacula sp.]
MNFMFSDIGSSFLGMIHQDIPKELLNANSAGAQKPVFATHLQKQVERLDSLETASSSDAASGLVQAGQNSNSSIAPLLGNLGQKKGIEFVSALKGILLKLSKGDLKNFSIDADGLEAVKKMLLTAGFKETDIDGAFSGLLEKAKAGKLTLDHLMGKLSGLPLEETTEEEAQTETFLEISALPFLESILTSLGIEKEDIQNILAEADKGEKGISLDVVIEKLKGLQKYSFQTQTAFKTPETDQNYQHLMKQLGMEQAEEISAPLSLAEFVDALENLQKKMSPEDSLSKGPGGSGNADQKNPISVSEKMPDLMNALFKGLEQVKSPEKLPGFGFSYEQIKNEFENRLLLPDQKGSNTSANSLFSVNKDVVPGTDTKLKDLYKNLEAFLSREENSEVGLESFQKEAGKALKQSKTENTKTIDPLQGLGTDAKSMDTQSTANGLRAKPALKDLPAYVTQQVSKSLVKAIHQGESILKLQLKPPELGRLVMTIDNTGNNMKINIITDNQAAKEILMSNINDIRAALSNSGVTLERFDVDMNSNFQQSMADARDQAGNSSKRQQRREKLAADSIAGISADDPTGLLSSLGPDGSLHYVA